MKKIVIVSALMVLILTSIGAYAFDWFGIKKEELKAPPRGAQAILTQHQKELKNLLIDVHSRNITLQNALADSNWLNFNLRDYSDPTTPTYRLRRRIEANLYGLFTSYKSLLRNYAADLDRVLTRSDGTPYRSGEFMGRFWSGTREPPCNSDLNMTRSEIVDELREGRCGAPQAKWIVYYRDVMLPEIEDVTSAARYENMNDVPVESIGEGYGGTETWTSINQRWSEYFGIYAATFKRAYEALFGSPIPPKFETLPLTLEPMRPE